MNRVHLRDRQINMRASSATLFLETRLSVLKRDIHRDDVGVRGVHQDGVNLYAKT